MSNDQEIQKFEDLTAASLEIGSTSYAGTVEPSIN